MGLRRRDEARARGRAQLTGRTARAVLGLALALATGLVVRVAAAAEHAHKASLPAGPIRDRHELMEGVGKNAKAIGAALKAHQPGDVVKPAAAIASVMDRFITLFPEGSIGQGSRAKPEIWADKQKFDELAMQVKARATALSEAAASGGDVAATSSALWKTCKACHDAFREPSEDD